MSTTSFTKTPQANDDYYWIFEDELGILRYGSTIALDVMANDLGGKAKTLFSIDDGNGNALDPTDLLNADALVNGVSAWETTAAGNRIRINNGKIELDLTNALSVRGAQDFNSLTANDLIEDSFIYAIRLGNGTLSWAHVTFNIQGQNDAATISGDITGMLGEDDTTPATGALVVSDPDSGESHTQVVTNAAGLSGLGTFSIDADGHWSYTVDNSLVQYLNNSQSVTDSFVFKSLDGSAEETVTVTIKGANEVPAWQPVQADAIAYGTFGASKIIKVATDGSLSHTGISLPNGGQFAYYNIIADVNNDGHNDVLVAGDNGLGRLYYNNGDGSFTDSGFGFPGNFQTRIAAADIDNDGDLDVYFSGGTGPSIVYQNNGPAGFQPVFSYDNVSVGGFFRTSGDAYFGDINGDGYVDLYMWQQDGVPRADKIFFNDGTGHFVDSGIALPTENSEHFGVKLGDVNNDGHLDIVRTPRGGSPAGVLINDGTGNFSVRQASFGPTDGSGVFLADIDGNGTLDAVTGLAYPTNLPLQWWSNDGTGQFTFAATLTANLIRAPLTLADFTRDGSVDIAYYDVSASQMKTLINDGAGNFTEGGSLQVAPHVFWADAGILGLDQII